MSKTAVVALGGNAITRTGQLGSHPEQAENALAMAHTVCALRDAGWGVVLVHGNGPQVGNLAIQQDAAAWLVPAQPLFSLGAMTEGQLGSTITLALHEAGGGRLPGVVTVVTHAVVSADDPAFDAPTKPIGPFYEAQRAQQLADEHGWTVAEDSGRGYRRLVPSPEPVRIVELDAIARLVEQGLVVIAAGGGGVPVIADGHGYRGVHAVIDKDLSAEKLASAMNAQALVLLTGVPQVMLDFGTQQARAVTELTVEEAERHEADGQFPAGSMGPKVRSAVTFVRGGADRTAVITTAELAGASLDPDRARGRETGTRIVASSALGAAV